MVTAVDDIILAVARRADLQGFHHKKKYVITIAGDDVNDLL